MRKTTTTEMPSPILPQPTSIWSLSNDLLLSCLARVSRLYYPTLSLVCKRFRSLLASPELYETRSLLSHTESCLYVCLKLPHDPNPRWFTLCLKPSGKKQEKKSSGHLLALITIPHSPQSHLRDGLATVAVGSSIYVIGGAKKEALSSKVSILDCRSHTWREGPSMPVERSKPEANVVDGKIYVTRGCKSFDMEVFDPKTQAWKRVLCPFATKCSSLVCYSRVIDAKIFIFGRMKNEAYKDTYIFGSMKCMGYKPEEDKWKGIRVDNFNLICGAEVTRCTIGNVLYGYSRLFGLQWYDTKMRRRWRSLNGLKSLPERHNGYLVEMVDYGGKLAILWVPYLQKTVIWCAVIALTRRNGEEILGNVEWSDAVLTVPASFEFVCALAATV